MDNLKRTASLFLVLGNEKKLRLLKMVEHQEGYAAELSVVVNLSRITTAKHLRAMTAAGLLSVRKTNYHVYYSLAPRNTRAGRLAHTICSWLRGDKRAARDIRLLWGERPR